MEQRFAPALRTLQNLLKGASRALHIPIPFALIGGLAVSAWGVVRATQDIDLLADSTPSPLRDRALRDNLLKFFVEGDCSAEWRVGEADDPIPLLLRLELLRPARTVGADILWAHKRWQQKALSRKISIKISGLELFVLHPEDLILMKLEAGGPQDLLDVEALLANSIPEVQLRRLKQKAAQLRLTMRLNTCLRGSSGIG